MNSRKFLALLLIFHCYSAFALKIPKNESKVINNYTKLFDKFSKHSCKPGYEFKYKSLLRDYRGSGIYYPTLGHSIDIKTIKENLSLVKDKKNWIQKEIKKLNEEKKLPKYSRQIIDLEKDITKLLELKGKVEFAKENIYENTQKSKELIKSFKKEFDEFINSISYMTNFMYPVDHLENRRMYDNFKSSKNGDRKANAVYFKRRLLEDGTLDEAGSNPDMFVRTSLDTIKLALDKEKDFLSENVRYDLEWTLSKLSKILQSGRRDIIKRLENWEKKVDQMIESYELVLKDGKNKNSLVSKILSDKDKATEQLIEYVYPKQANVYRYWLKQSELNRALYVLSTLLFNEVGDVDPSGLEREDVLKIVMNRKQINYYRKLHPRQRLSKMLGKKERDGWLNLLFRLGEFSFTYYFIPSVKKIFCPDMSRRGKSLRRENLKIALEILRTYKKGFQPTRYYSRHSMVGKIDMASVWQSYKAEPEKVGKKISNSKKLLKLLKSDRYRYLYKFTDDDKVDRYVIEFEGNPFVVTRRKNNLYEFHGYRNPHYFTYFTKL